MTRSYIRGLGFYVPPKVVTNDDLAKMMDTSDAWNRERTGIETRHFVEAGVGASDRALEAAKGALSDAKADAKEIDFIILATLSADYQFPGASALLQAKLGISAGGGPASGGQSMMRLRRRKRCPDIREDVNTALGENENLSFVMSHVRA